METPKERVALLAAENDLQYRDIIILCNMEGDTPPVVTRLREHGLPVQVVTSHDDEAAIRDVALAVTDSVTVTDHNVVRGLERRVVVVMGWVVGDERLHAMSRSTSYLIWVGQPLSFDNNAAAAVDDDVSVRVV